MNRGKPARQLIDCVVLHIRVEQLRLLSFRQRIGDAIRHSPIQHDRAWRNQERAIDAGERIIERVGERIFFGRAREIQRQHRLAASFANRQNGIGILRRLDDNRIAAAFECRVLR